MHHVVLERWSRGTSLFHARDPRVKIVATLAFLIAVATTPSIKPPIASAYAMLVLVGALVARLPLTGLLTRACVVLPFTGTFALVSLMAGDSERALALLLKSYLSALVVLLLVGTTPMPRLLHGLERLGTPRMLVLVVQFLYRYLFLISEQGQHMRLAALCRGGGAGKHRRSRFRAAAGALAVLFGRSYQRAESIHQAMLARGFEQRITLLSRLELKPPDIAFLVVAVALPVGLRLSEAAVHQWIR